MKQKLFSNRIFYVATALPILFITTLIMHYGVNVPTFDQWELVPYIQELDNHTLAVSDLFAQHNEHRIFFPRIVMLGLGHFTHWNVVAEMMASLAVQILSFILIWKAIRRTLKGNLAKICVIFASIAMFNPMQWENWLWGWQIQWYLTILGMIMALYFGYYLPLRRRWANHVIAISAATVATFSLAGGVVAWPILVCFLVFRGQVRALPGYLVAFLVNLGVYAHHYHSVAGHTPIDSLFHNELEFFRYLFLYLGGSISNDDQIAPILGAASLVIFLVFGVKSILSRQKSSYFWIGLGAFVIANAVITGSGRFLLGPEQALASRYTSFSLLWILAIFVLVVPYLRKIILRPSPWLQPIAITCLLVTTSLFAVTSFGGVMNARTKSLRDRQASECLSAQELPDSHCFSLVYPSTPDSDKQNSDYLKFLRAEHLVGR